MSEIIPILVFVGILCFVSVVKKLRAANARAVRPHPAPDRVSKPAEPKQDDRFDGAESAFNRGGFEDNQDFQSNFGTEPDASFTYEEGVDPCHDDMEHVHSEETEPNIGMDQSTANELVRGFVISEILSRKRRR